jgi:hypothetical protein
VKCSYQGGMRLRGWRADGGLEMTCVKFWTVVMGGRSRGIAEMMSLVDIAIASNVYVSRM